MRNLYFLISLTAVFALLSLSPSVRGKENVYQNRLGMEFVRIEPGRFMMGSPPDAPLRGESEKPHKAIISEPFYMQTTEVTIGQWQAVMGKKWLFPRKGPKNLPVTDVSWHDCQKFIKKLNRRTDQSYRLPTETEWEYACRAGTQTAFFWGDNIECTRAMYANSAVKSGQCVETVRALGLETNGPAPVKSYEPNDWGLYDMHGNVWEWCRDCFDQYPLPEDPGTFECVRRVRRGGSWYSDPHSLRSANRAYAHPAAKFKTTGFRLVKEAD